MASQENILIPKDSFSKFRHVQSELVWGNYDNCLNPKVSIVIPAFNRPEYFRLSIQSALNQDYNEIYEIVVVDNNPVSEGKNANQLIIEELNRSNIFYYRNAENIGMLGNWNRCIELARAEFLTFCHDDDMLLSTALTRLMYIQKSTGDNAIFSTWNKMDKDGNLTYVSNHSKKYKYGKILSTTSFYELTMFDFLFEGYGYGIGCLFNSKNLKAIGGFNSDFYPSADYALMILYTFKFGSFYNAVATFNYRIAENESLNVYEKFCIVDRKFRNDIKSKIYIPNFILNRFINAKYNIDKYSFAIEWGKKDPSTLELPSNKDYSIVNLFKKIQNFRRFKLFGDK